MERISFIRGISVWFDSLYGLQHMIWSLGKGHRTWSDPSVRATAHDLVPHYGWQHLICFIVMSSSIWSGFSLWATAHDLVSRYGPQYMIWFLVMDISTWSEQHMIWVGWSLVIGHSAGSVEHSGQSMKDLVHCWKICNLSRIYIMFELFCPAHLFLIIPCIWPCIHRHVIIVIV